MVEQVNSIPDTDIVDMLYRCFYLDTIESYCSRDEKAVILTLNYIVTNVTKATFQQGLRLFGKGTIWC
jgi:hypothetical protein